MTDDAELAAIDARMAAGYPLDVDVYADRRKLRAMLDVARAESEKLVESVAQYHARLDAVNAERNAHQRESIRMHDRVQALEAENSRLNIEMAAYRQGCTAQDAAAMLSVVNALEAEKARCGPRSDSRCRNMMHKRYAMLGCTECSDESTALPGEET